MTDKEKLHQILSSLWKNDNSVGKTYYNQALQDLQTAIDLQEEPVSEDLEEACDSYYNETWDEHGGRAMVVDGCHDIWFPSLATDDFFKAGAKWQKEHLWKPADGDDLPEYEREVVVLHQPYPLEGSEYAVGFAHRPDPKGWDGTNIATGKIEHYTPKTYDKGGWNIHNIKWFLDLELPVEVEKFI